MVAVVTGDLVETPLLLSSGRCDFTLIRVRAEVKMDRMPRGARILSNFSLLSLTHRGCARSSVALPAGSPLLVKGERTVLGKLVGFLLQVLGEPISLKDLQVV